MFSRNIWQKAVFGPRRRKIFASKTILNPGIGTRVGYDCNSVICNECGMLVFPS